uniref:ATP synthase subunit d, mitochondrial n=1 Tax=Cyclopterus lumpus TaxID=8103 RepID=A0A8C2W8H3_CYCLU
MFRMAGRRAAMKSIDWGMFNALKTRSDAISAKLVSLPETPATIDWSHYRSTVAKAGMVDEFEKKVIPSQKIPEPVDTQTSAINAQEAESVNVFGKTVFITCSFTFFSQLDNFKNMIPFDQMTIEDLNHTFPETKLDKVKYPYWPHKPIADL